MKLYLVVKRVYEQGVNNEVFKEDHHILTDFTLYTKEEAIEKVHILNSEESYYSELYDGEDNPITLIAPYEVITLNYE